LQEVADKGDLVHEQEHLWGGEGLWVGGVKMISLEKARALKDAGLEWEPGFGDIAWDNDENAEAVIFRVNNGIYLGDAVWLPRLGQLLAEIRKHRNCALYVFEDWFEVELPKIDLDSNCFKSDTPEDAAADALLWILTQQ
jgi:hypothetical protein